MVFSRKPLRFFACLVSIVLCVGFCAISFTDFSHAFASGKNQVTRVANNANLQFSNKITSGEYASSQLYSSESLPKQRSEKQGEKTVLIGMGGVSWQDISPKVTPRMYALAKESASAMVSIRAIPVSSTPEDGWLTLASGARARAPLGNKQAKLEKPGEFGALARNFPKGVPATQKPAEQTPASQTPSSQNLTEQNTPTYNTPEKNSPERNILAIGKGAIFGLTSQARDEKSLTSRIHTIANISELTENDVKNSDLVVVDAGNVSAKKVSEARKRGTFSDAVSEFKAHFTNNTDRDEAQLEDIRAIDKNIGEIIDLVDASSPQTRIILTGLADSQPSARLGVFMMRPPNPDARAASLAFSTSTQTKGLVQLIDIAPTITGKDARRTSVSPVITAGSKADADTTIRTLTSRSARADIVRGEVGPFYTLLALGVIVSVVYGFLIVRRCAKIVEKPLPGGLRESVAFVAALPLTSIVMNIVPWWDFARPGMGFCGMLIIVAALLAAWALRPVKGAKDQPMPLARPLLRLGSLTGVVILCDLLQFSIFHGPSLTQVSPMGSQPAVAGRFFGQSNTMYALLAIGMLCLTVLILRALPRYGVTAQRWHVATVVIVAIVTIVFDVAPAIGADFGGPPALAVAFAYLLWHVLGKRFTLVVAMVAFIVGYICTICAAILDHLFGEISHLGAFVTATEKGGAWEIVSRKISQLFFGMPVVPALILAGVLGIVFIIFLRAVHLGKIRFPWKNSRHPLCTMLRDDDELRTLHIASLLALVVAVPINDSGVVIFGAGIALLLPTLIIALDTWVEKEKLSEKRVNEDTEKASKNG
ncbi:alkaline phosphatase family protein [Actinotignum urinale]|uniref:hypothetical protein n=1 Tax=Actinotignum urinale TaxID=190146 RepID=UPI000418709C|nr:hypothetical protein [Actinotignum urinale]MDY5160625.1 hypothetical protein [Actinotignum urinale]